MQSRINTGPANRIMPQLTALKTKAQDTVCRPSILSQFFQNTITPAAPRTPATYTVGSCEAYHQNTVLQYTVG